MTSIEQLSQSEREDFYRFAVWRFNNTDADFDKKIGIHMSEIGWDYAAGELEIARGHQNHIEIAHGGCIATLADTVAGIAATSRGVPCVTVCSDMHFLGAASKGKLICRSSPLQVGSTISVFNAQVTDQEGKPIAFGTFTFRMLPHAGPTIMEKTWRAQKCR